MNSNLLRKCVSVIFLTLMTLTSCDSYVKKELRIGHCVVNESDKFKLFSQDPEHILLSSPQAGINVYIGKANPANLKRIWTNYTILDKNHKIERFSVGNEVKDGIVTKSVHNEHTRLWVHIPVYPDTFIRIDYLESLKEQAGQQNTIREFLKTVSISP